MCGLTGIFAPVADMDHDQMHATVTCMAETMQHRGPDDSGSWVDAAAGIALGFRRLAIVDLTTEGHQPMVSTSGRYVMIFNGEIYNFRELRRELESAGHNALRPGFAVRRIQRSCSRRSKPRGSRRRCAEPWGCSRSPYGTDRSGSCISCVIASARNLSTTAGWARHSSLARS